MKHKREHQHNAISATFLRAIYENCNIKKICKLLNRNEDIGIYSHDELRNIVQNYFPQYNHYDLEGQLKTYFVDDISGHGDNDVFDFFDIVYNLAGNLVIKADNRFCFKYEFTDIWINTIRSIGEELIATAGVLIDDKKRDNNDRSKMDWAYCLEHDNHDLRVILERDEGVSENHFHLRSSSPYYEISWIYLMNNVSNELSDDYEIRIDNIEKNALSEQTNKRDEYPLSIMWRKAAALRVELFTLINQSTDNEKNNIERYKHKDECEKEESEYYNINFWIQMILEADSLESMPIEQIQRCISKYPKSGVDYAHNNVLYCDNRSFFLAGEREIIYKSLKKIFSPSNNNQKFKIRVYLFIYLMIKYHFFQEMIQVNNRVGFYNFNAYQARKDWFIPWDNEENVATATIYSVIDKMKIHSFELRIYMGESSKDIESDVQMYDRAIDKAISLTSNYRGYTYSQNMCYYTLSFIKRHNNKETGLCRDYQLRETINKQVAALIEVQKTNMANRIKGIDAAGEEMNCRPEVFGPAFRRLLHYSKHCPGNQLKATYHVGEDNHDILDGLRAIHEAIQFLDLRAGCRLGHTTLLGIDPVEYYNENRNPETMPCQVFLDNLVWMYYYIIDNDVEFEGKAELFEYVKNKFEEYLHKIYGDKLRLNYIKQKMINIITEDRISQNCNFDTLDFDFSMKQYYYSYLLRGDVPELYLDFYNEIQKTSYFSKQYKICDSNYDMKIARSCLEARYMCYLYNYDDDVEKNGNEYIKEVLPDYYVNCAVAIQKKMCQMLSYRGIAIETNPTSNILISDIKDYSEHPISAFYDNGLKHNSTETQLNVSINTDDRSVFSTSLSNEYAYLMYFLENKKDEKGENLYTRFNILKWLDEIRKMGNEQAF